jgi:hypothetical protein
MLDAQPVDQVLLAGTTGPERVERPTDANFLRRGGDMIKIGPLAGTKPGQQVDEIINSHALRVA